MGLFDRFRNRDNQNSKNSDNNSSNHKSHQNFTFLQNLINSGISEINLDSDILLNDNEISQFRQQGIVIDNSLVIDGNGYSIDAKGKVPLFRFFPNNNVILKNITLKNGIDANGGAIRNLSNLKIINCTFEGNNANVGGAIENQAKMDIVQSKFENNKANSVGGSIVNFTELSVKDCEFYSCFANLEGGAINNQKNAILNVFSSRFENCSSMNAGAISSVSETFLSDCNFVNNTSKDMGGALFSMEGNLKIDNCRFDRNTSKNGGAIVILKDSYLEVKSSEFNENNAKYGASLYIYGELKISDSSFTGNVSLDGDGAVIFIESDAKAHIFNCIFSKNESLDSLTGSILTNIGDTILSGSKFFNNKSIQGGGINNQPQGNLNISNCIFKENRANLGGGIINFGKLSLDNSKFYKNYVDASAGALDNGEGGEITVSNCKFFDNLADYSGGSIRNLGKMILSDCNLKNNVSFIGGAIDNAGELKIDNSNFMHNHSKQDAHSASAIGRQADIIYNSNDLRISDSKFIEDKDFSYLNNDDLKNSIINIGSLEIVSSVFQNIFSQSVLLNSEEGTLQVLNSTFAKNHTLKSNIFNIGESCSVIKPVFNENFSLDNQCMDIINKSNLSLQKPKFEYVKASKSILNEGIMSLRSVLDSQTEDYIVDNGKIIILDKMESDIEENEINVSEFNFSGLDNLVSMFTGDDIILKEDFTIDDFEIDFYEGGIILDKKGLTIDGNGHTIDAKGKSRIFIVAEENINLKNIVFKNGFFSNDFDKSANGGGVLRIIKGGSLNLVNCKFINSNSEGNGGVIYNRSVLNSNSSSFNNNNSEWMGGAVYNHGKFVSVKDTFSENSSKLGAAIYNYSNLVIDSIELLENKSNIDQQIFNNGSIICDKGIQNGDLIYNNGNINEDMISDSIPFNDLNSKISNSNEIFLNEDVVFDFRCDQEFKKGIPINKNLIIDGKGHSIDAKKSSAFFAIMKHDVMFKNIVFKNGFSDESPLIQNKGSLTFENCKFDNNKMQGEVNLIVNSNSIKINNCVFSNNYSAKNPIFYTFNDDNENSFEIYNSDFFANSSYQNSIFNFSGNPTGDSNIIIDKSRFINNISFLNGTIFHNFDAKFDLKNSGFIDNYSNLDSVLKNDVYANTKITNCKFIKNNSNNTIISNRGNLECHNSKFSFNQPKSKGALCNDLGELKVFDCIFNENKSELGAAITNYSKLSISKSIFTKNFADFGGVINNQKAHFDNQEVILIISDCRFSENSAIHNGGAIDIIFGVINISDSIFESNYSEETAGAISFSGSFDIKSSIVGCKFFENHSNIVGGVIYNQQNSHVFINDSLFESNSTEKSGGAIHSLGHIEIVSSKFKNNYAKEGAGAIGSFEDGSIKVLKCNFRDNHVDELEGKIFGNAMLIDDKAELIDSNFYENSAVIYRNPIMIHNCNFMEKVVKKDKDDLNIGGDGNFKLL